MLLSDMVQTLAVAIEIQSAVIEGVITGAVLLAGVVLSEWLTRRREWRSRLEHAAHRLSLLIPVVLTYLSDAPPEPSRVDAGSAGWYFQQEMLDSLFELDLLVRHRRSPANRQVRLAVDDLADRIKVATSRAIAGDYLTHADTADISTNALTDAVHGRRRKPHVFDSNNSKQPNVA